MFKQWCRFIITKILCCLVNRASQLKTSLPAVFLSKYDDSIQPLVPFKGKFDLANLQTFIYENKLPKLVTFSCFNVLKTRFIQQNCSFNVHKCSLKGVFKTKIS